MSSARAERNGPFALPYVFPEDRDLAGSRVLIVGLGLFGGGLAVARFMARLGARITITDLRDREILAEPLAGLEGIACKFVLGEHREADFRAADFVVVGPGVPPDLPFLHVAIAAGARLVSEVGLTLTRLATPRIALVTGSKGKSTTTALVHHMASRVGRSWLGGNIGRPLLDVCDQVLPDDVVAFEVSSFQLEQLRGAPFSARVGVITNLFPVHLDRHGDFATYTAVKQEVLAHVDVAVMSCDDPAMIPFAQGFSGRTRWFGRSAAADRRLLDDRLMDAEGHPILACSDLRIRGAHNRMNVAAGLLAAECLGIGADEAAAAAKDFLGLPHRLETVTDRDGVRYVNDSIATTVRSVIAALEAFDDAEPGRVVLIVGGKDSGSPLDAVVDPLRRRSRAVVAMGEAGPRIAADLRDRAADIDVRVVRDLSEAVGLAREIARSGDVVVMSPGFPSFDQFRNFADRGDSFRRLAILDLSR